MDILSHASSPRKEIEYIDFLALWMSHTGDIFDDGRRGLYLENVNITLGDLTEDDFDFLDPSARAHVVLFVYFYINMLFVCTRCHYKIDMWSLVHVSA